MAISQVRHVAFIVLNAEEKCLIKVCLTMQAWPNQNKPRETSPKGANSSNLGKVQTHLITVALRIAL